MLKQVGKALRILSDDEKEKIAIVIDGPTVLQNFKLSNLSKLKKALKEIGSVRFGTIITDQQITQKDSSIITSQGFQEEVVGSDVDIHVSIRSLEMMNNNSIDIVIVGTTDPNLYPILTRIKKEKKLGLISWEGTVTPSLEAVADYILYLDMIK